MKLQEHPTQELWFTRMQRQRNPKSLILQKSTKRGTLSESITYSATAGTLYIKINSFGGAFNASSCYTLNVQAPNGIYVSSHTNNDAQAQSGIRLYPNPAKDIVNISLDKVAKNSTLRIYDLFGRVLIEKNVSELKSTVDIKQLPAGLYFVKVFQQDGEEIYNTKFVKQ